MNDNELMIPDWTKEEYISSTTPYEWLYQFKDDTFKMSQLREQIKIKAGIIGVKSFITIWNAYVAQMKKLGGEITEAVTCFDGQEAELICGDYTCDDYGIQTTDKYGFEVLVCSHPIMPIKRMVNIDTGEIKIEIAFKRGNVWRQMVVDKSIVSSAQKIVELAKYGVAVDSESAKHLVKYFTAIESLNYEKLDEINSVGRLGWIGDYGFSPYVDNLKFDGEICYKNMFNAVQCRGSFSDWLDFVKDIRKSENIISKIMLAASFASALVEPCSALPFFVHLWGGTESGKTVALMFAASVWANPTMGEYIKNFNATSVGQEMTAGFVNSMPLIIDELQISRERKDFDQMIYMLAEGAGRGRGSKNGGIQRVQTWKNCILTTGEQPITNSASGAGAINRIVEIDCKEFRIFKNPVDVVEFVRKNYGWGGKLFVMNLQADGNLERAINMKKEFYNELISNKKAEKQAMAASVILAADKLINEWIFRDGQTLNIKDIEPYLVTKDDINANKRAYEWLKDFVASNQTRFMTSAFDTADLWGILEDDLVYFNRTSLNQKMLEGGFNPEAFISWAKRNNLLICDYNRNTKNKRLPGMRLPIKTICVKLAETENPLDFDENEPPF